MHKTREEGRGRMMRGQGGEWGDVLNTVSLTDWFGKFSQREWAVDKEEDITVTLQCNTVHTERLHTPHDYSMSTSLFASALRFCPGERSEINVSPTWKTKREMKTETLTGADIKAKDKAANRVIECRTKTRFFMNDLKKKKEREREIEGFPCFFFLPALGDLQFPSRPLITASVFPQQRSSSLISKHPGGSGTQGLVPQGQQSLPAPLTCLAAPASFRTFGPLDPSFSKRLGVGWRRGPDSRRGSRLGEIISIPAESRSTLLGLRVLNWREEGVFFYVVPPF